AQVRSPLDVWNRFFGGCARTAGQEHLCACAATEMIARCQALGVTDPEALAQCLVSHEPTWNDELTRMCTSYGQLRLGPNVPRPTPRAVTGTGPAVSRDALFAETFRSCRQASPNDAMRDLGCVCVAVYSVEACAPRPDTPAHHVQACGERLGPEVERVFPQCRQFTSIVTPARAAPSPATRPGAPVGASDGATVCRAVDGFSAPDQRAACAPIVDAILRDDLDVFLATIPRGGRVELFGRARQATATVRREIRRHGLREMLGPHVRAIIGGSDEDPHLVLFSVERDDQALDWIPEAAFRWDTGRGRWDLVAIRASEE
ncbi:MAG: hypothetical protein KC619_10415, partial [Myxococcales bacterium]|nr:hypothetical protein [Myxococcales bacterium]